MTRLLVSTVLLVALVGTAQSLDLNSLLGQSGLLGKFDPTLLANFTQLAEKFGKKLSGDVTELTHKLESFKLFGDLVKQHQQKERGTAKHGMTKFFDFTPAEFHKFFNGHRQPANTTTKAANRASRHRRQSLPDSIDYRDQGVVTPVKDQGSCGDCYAFTSIAVLESALALNGNEQNSDLSEAEATDCTFDYSCNGCNGGWGGGVFQYIQDNSGVTDEATYPFDANADHTSCHLPSNSQLYGSNIDQVLYASSEDEIAEYLVNHGPLYLAIDSSPLQTYTGGIVDVSKPDNGWNVDHAVTLIGYGTDSDSGLNYWLCKNSWGADWGEDGFFRVVRGNNCLDLTSNPTSITLS